MSSRFPPACESAPSPALWVRETDQVEWEQNPAAAAWPPTAHWTAAEWRSLARSVLQAHARGDSDAECLPLRVRWRALPVDDAVVAWLLPLHEAGDAERQALREQVETLAEPLRVAGEVGRLGVWERDLRTGRMHWNDPMFRAFGFDAVRGTPTHEEALQRVHADDRGRLEGQCAESMQRSGQVHEGRYRVARPDGSVARVHLGWRVEAGADGRPERICGVMFDDTESVGALQRQQAASTQIALAVGLVGISLWRVDLATRRIYLNDWGYELIGKLPQADGMPLAEMRACVHPDDLQAVVQAGDEALAGSGIVVDTEARYQRPDGSYRTLLTRRTAERDESGQPIALVGVSLDVTEQVKARQRAQEATQSIDLIAEATGVGVWTTDVETRMPVWNQQMWRIFDVPEDIALPQARREAIQRLDPADRAQLDDAYAELAGGGPAAEELEFRLRRRDGEVRWVVGRARAALHGDRRIVFGMFIDVTEQRLTQERLRRAEQRTLLAAQAVGLALWERDLVGGDTWWDAQMYRLRGLSPDDPRAPNELRHTCIHPDDVPYVERRTEEIIAGESDYTFDFRVCWPDGTVRWLATRGTVVRDDAGQPQRILGFNWDITEHKRSEDMRREKAAAEEASRAKSEFLSRMSHELRTPLNAVLGFAQLMLEDPSQSLPDRHRERTERIRNAGKHLLALIDDVLDLASVEVGGVSTAPVVLAPLVQETLQWLAPAARQASVELVAGALHGSVMADARRLRQVVANLLSNAVKYNRAGGRALIECVDGDDPAMLGLRVRDTGRGLTEAQMQRLFEPFNRLGAERSNIEGTGIGLTIVRALVEHMGGRIEVDSRAGEGSEFRVWLPRAAQAAHADAPPLAGAPAAETPAPAGIDVLYIEDNAINVMLVQELVTLRPNVRLHVAPDGHSGIARAKALRPACVLIDLQLPDIDGFKVLAALRADPALRGVECIALSANAMPDDIARARRAGFDDYWTKPIDFKQFLGGLDRVSLGG
jgi:PAS domain S-box-containing protein